MQQPGVAQQHRPIEARWIGSGERGGGAVVQHFAGTMPGTVGMEVEPHAARVEDRIAHVHSMPAQGCPCRTTECVVRQYGDDRRVMAEGRQRHRHVGFRATDLDVQLGLLQQQAMTRRGQTQQHFAETQDPISHQGVLRWETRVSRAQGVLDNQTLCQCLKCTRHTQAENETA